MNLKEVDPEEDKTGRNLRVVDGQDAAAYAAAYEVHYTTKDLVDAIVRYKKIINAGPCTKEANYSRTQIQNIVYSVVPKPDLLICKSGLL